MTMTKRRTKKYLAARVLCTLLLGTYLTGGYGELIGHASDPTVTGPVIKGSDDIKTWVQGKSSAWGGSTVADGWYATAWGDNTAAIGNMNTAFGSKTKATGGSDATAFGYCTTASGVGATAFGTNTTASGWAATSWGYNAEGDTKKVLANGLASTAFGRSTLAGGDYSTAFGYNTEAGGVMATAYGRNTKALSDNSTAWGYGAQAGQLLYGSDKTEAAIVRYTNSDGKTRFKIVDAKNTATTLKDDFISYSAAYEDSELAIVGAQATAFGKNTKATGVRSTAFGYSSTASGDDSTAFGVETVASGSGATAWGGSIDEELTLKGGMASGLASTAFGVETVASGSYSTVWGVWSKASNNLATAWGVSTRSTGISSTAWGAGTLAIDDRSTAFGYSTQAGQLLYGTDKIEATIERYTKDGETKYRIVNASDWSDILDNNEGTGFASYEDAFKAKGLTRTGEQATAFGENTKATGASSTAFGYKTTASGDYSTAFGYRSKASGKASTAFGLDTTASGDYSTAFGTSSLAYGRDSTAFGNMSKASGVDSTAFGAVTEAIGDCSTAFGYGTQAGRLLYGEDKTEALIRRYKDGDIYKYKIVDANNTSTTLKEGFASYEAAIKAEGLTKTGGRATAFGQSTKATGLDSTAFGWETTASGDGSTAFGQKSTASGYYSTAFGYNTTAGGHYSAAWGSNSVASGSSSTAFGIYTEATGKGAVAWGVGEKGVGITLAHGESSTAFGKKSRAFGDNSLAALGGITGVGSIASLDGVTWVNFVPGTGEGAVAIGEGATAEASYTYAIGKNAKVLDAKTENAIAIGNDTSVTAVGGVALGSEAVASVDKDVAGYDPSTGATSTDTSGAWTSTHAAISIGTADGSVTRQITGVAAGSKDTDAVNVAQLKAAADAKLDKTVFNEYKAATAATLGLMQNAITQNADDISDLQTNKLDKAVYEADKADTKAALDGKANVALDNITEDGKTVIKDLAKGAVNVVGDGPVSVEKSDVSGVDTYTVSVKTDGKVEDSNTGIVTGGTVYSEVRPADGTYVKATNTTAANLGALDKQVDQNAKDIKTNADGIKDLDGRVTQNTNDIADLKANSGADMTAVNHRISNLDSKVNKVGAGAAALAALHPLDTDNKFTMAAGFGNYRNANAMALGMFYRPTDTVMFSVGGAMGNGENMINAGVSFALDKGVGTSKAAMARTIKAQGDRIAEQDAKIQSLEAYNAKLEERLAALEAKIGK